MFQEGYAKCVIEARGMEVVGVGCIDMCDGYMYVYSDSWNGSSEC